MKQLLFILISLIFLNCSSSSISGNSSETGNCKIIGIANIDENTPAAGIPVVLAPANYHFSHSEIPDTVWSDENGRFEFPTVSAGNWTLSSLDSQKRGFIHRDVTLEPGDSISLNKKVQKTGTVKLTRASAVNAIPVSISGTPWGKLFNAGETELYLEDVPTNEEVEIIVDTVPYSVQADSLDTAKIEIISRAVILTGTGESDLIEQYRTLIEAENITLSIVESDTLNTNHISEAEIVIIIGSPAFSEKNAQYLRETTIPLMNSSLKTFPLLDMTAGAADDFGVEPVTRFNTFTDYNHPIMDELIDFNSIPGSSIEVVSTEELFWGKPGNQAAIIGVLAVNQDASPLFCYEKDINMITSPAPARRVGIFANGAPLMMYGEQIYTGALQWLLGKR